MKFKIFSGHNLQDLENQVNAWLSDTSVQIVSTQQSAIAGRVQDTTRALITLSIFYKPLGFVPRDVE